MRITATLAAGAAVLLLAACDGGHGDATANGTAFSLNVQDEDGGFTAKADNGAIAVNSPVFSGKLNIPGLQLGGDHMDIDGMKPFPGTRFAGINVDATDKKDGGEDHAKVQMNFSAPAAADKVLAYYADAAKRAGYETAGASGGKVEATKSDGSRLTVTAAPAAGGSTGTLIVNDKG